MSDKNKTKSDDVFVALVTTRVDKHQRKRKTFFIVGVLLSIIVTFAGFLLLPSRIFDIDAIGMSDILTGLLLLAICAIAAVATESRSA